MIVLIVLVSTITGGLGLFVFGTYFREVGEVTARTMTFQILGLSTLWYVFATRMLSRNIWEESLLINKWLVLAVLVGLGLMVLPVELVWLRELFELSRLSIYQWVWVMGLSMSGLIAIEAVKWIFSRLKRI